MMSKNYSLVEIQSLLETVQDEIFSILLDPSPNANSRFFENFTHIALRTFKYLAHYLNALRHDDTIGPPLALIYQNFHRSMDQYKGRNIYAESYLSTPLAMNEEENKEEDEIYHFLNTRNNNIPLACLGTPELDQERIELALFVQQMEKKKKTTFKEPKRSLQIPQEHAFGLKVTRKTTYDPSFKQPIQRDTLDTPAPTDQPPKPERQEQVQTQTDCLLHEFQTQTEKEEEQAKSQAESCFKSEITVGFDQNLPRDEGKKKTNISLKNKKGAKTADGKNSHKKKKAHIASSVKITEKSADDDKKARKEAKTEMDEDISLKNQCSIRTISMGLNIQIISKQVNITYCKEKFVQIENQGGSRESEEKESEKAEQMVSRLAVVQFGKTNGMQVINQTQQEHYHPQLKSDPSECRLQTINSQLIKVSQTEEKEPANPKKTHKEALVRVSQVLPVVSVQINQNGQAALNHGEETQDPIDKKHLKHHQRKSNYLDKHFTAIKHNDHHSIQPPDHTTSAAQPKQHKLQKEESLAEGSSISVKESKKKMAGKEKPFLQPIRPNQQKKEYISSIETQLTAGETSESCVKGSNTELPPQHTPEEAHLAPISQNNHIDRFSKINVRKSNIQNIAKRLKNKFMHSADYLDKYANKQGQRLESKLAAFKQNQLQTRNSFEKSSLIVINNRNRTAVEVHKLMEKRQIFYGKQSKSHNKTKIKLINLSKLNQDDSSKKLTQEDSSKKLTQQDSSKKLSQQDSSKKLSQETVKKIIAEKAKQLQSQQPKSLKDNEYMNYGSTLQSLNSSCLKTSINEEEKPITILMNKKIAESCHIAHSQSDYKLIAKQLRQRNKREMIQQYLELIQASHRKFCGQKCAHIDDLYKKVNLDGTKEDQNIIDQLLRLIKKTN